MYTVRLTVDGKAHSERVVVTNDPRSPVNLAALRAEDALIRKLNASERLAWDAFQQVDTMRAQLRAMTPSDSTSDLAKTIRASIAKLDSLGGRVPASGGGFAGFGGGGTTARPNFVQLVNGFLRQLGTFDNGDIAPTAAMLAAYKSACNDLGKSVAVVARIQRRGSQHIERRADRGGQDSVSEGCRRAGAGVWALGPSPVVVPSEARDRDPADRGP